MQNRRVKGYRSRQLIRMVFSCAYLKKMQTKLLLVADYVQKVYLYMKIYTTVIEEYVSGSQLPSKLISPPRTVAILQTHACGTYG